MARTRCASHVVLRTDEAVTAFKTETQRFLARHPVCCFCGGGTPATTRDHVPAKCMFDGKRRPNALVFPSCERCQTLSKGHELVAAMVARMLPDSKTRAQKLEVAKYIERAGRAVPGLLEELLPTPEQRLTFERIRHAEPRAAGVLNHGGPLLNHSMQLFGVKLTCALYYQHTGRIVGIDSAISVREYSNADAIQGELPSELINFLGEAVTLDQGSWSVPDQFWYSHCVAAEHPAAFFAAFRLSFAILGIVWAEASDVPTGGGMATFSPTREGGFIRIR